MNCPYQGSSNLVFILDEYRFNSTTARINAESQH